ncbi:TadE family protein [Caldovatus aquaticus]|uniref:Pilus assembly protein n=1 Tax=Caldovatus aquaticus TaxID=2865671 RepID=A0ABS7F274_9PROT|nr:TadE family protein [Caldovatus aquaticus]MBW8269077.1 pilus assembly protein [Caldovatus aquaticus]
MAAAIRRARVRRTGARLVRRLRDRRGVSALEFALLLPVLITVLMGAFDLGNAFQQSIRLEAAARAGAQAAFYSPAADSNGRIPTVETLVKNNLPAEWKDLTVTARVTLYRCDNGTDSTTYSSSCSTPKVVQIDVSRPFTFVGPLTQYMLPFLSPVRGNVEVRLM